VSVGDYQEAERLLLLAVPEIEHASRPDEVKQIVFATLRAVYEATGRPDEARRWSDGK